jgi:hypothetical protein
VRDTPPGRRSGHDVVWTPDRTPERDVDLTGLSPGFVEIHAHSSIRRYGRPGANETLVREFNI